MIYNIIVDKARNLIAVGGAGSICIIGAGS